ncbi:MAG: TraR/DksA C4-type zinc finger protein [Candidatus Curtissbacteria bacterium]|nr:TraR/DksA C4-type zinc finger protein [Candidatus Curtissbacteria bacterium]
MIGIGKITGKREALFKKVRAQKKAIVEKLSRLRRDDPFSSADRSLIVEPATDAAMLFGHEQSAVLEKRLQGDLKEIEKALKKIKKGTYGICERCGKKISEARLEVKPSAIYCLKCEKELESKK